MPWLPPDHPMQYFVRRKVASESPVPLQVRSNSVFIGGLENGNQIKNIMASAKETIAAPGSSGSADLLLSKITEDLPKQKQYRRSNNRRTLNTLLLEAVESGNELEVQRLLEVGASPDATSHVDSISACHIAAMADDRSLALLLEYGAHKHRTDRLGRTPLHIASWAGHIRHLALFLEFPPEIQRHIQPGEVTKDVEDKVRELRASLKLKEIVDLRCKATNIEVPEDWRAGVDYEGSKVAERLPHYQPGWTPLHAASYSARYHCVRLLLAVGADPCFRDDKGRTPLDIAGSAYYDQAIHTSPSSLGFTEVVALLLATECDSHGASKPINLQILFHTAVELESLESINLLLGAGAFPVNSLHNGQTPLHVCVAKQNKELLQAFIYSDSLNSQSLADPVVNMKNKDGYTVLHYSVLTNWLPGVCLTLEAGADVISTSYMGETPLITAVFLGHLDILKEVLLYSNKINSVNQLNKQKDSALCKAVETGNIECVNMLLDHGASIQRTMQEHFPCSVLHIAAYLGQYDMLKFLLDYNYTITQKMVNYTGSWMGYGPIQLAAESGHIECFKLLLSYHADIKLKTADGSKWTPLHIVASTNNLEIAKFILKNDISTMYVDDTNGWTAFHVACFYASRDVIKLFLHGGADLSACTKTLKEKIKKTAIQLIMKRLSKPTEFVLEFFDSCVSCNESYLHDVNCEVTVDYKALVPSEQPNPIDVDDMNMKVLNALLQTGNSYNQKRLLIHPLVESFLFLKWKALRPFFCIMLVLYGFFVVTLSLFIFSVYFYRDSYLQNNITATVASIDRGEVRTEWLHYKIWMYILYFMICLIVLQELLFMQVSKRYLLQFETWVKISSIVLAAILPIVTFSTKEDWPRHLATLSMLLAYLQMTFLLSRFPKWGYYVLMCWKVAIKVFKILLTFVFLVVGFALSFMIEHRFQEPFENPWAAFIKTMVMMTSEFDYDDLVKRKDSSTLNSSLVIIRLLFLIFLILAAIVLMNLMVSAAVNDLNALEVQGNIVGLEKQVEFLTSLETLANVKVFMKILPNKLKHKLKYARSLSKISIKPCEYWWSEVKDIPVHIREAIFKIAQSQKEKKDVHVDFKDLQKKIAVIFNTVQVINPDIVKKQIEAMNLKLDTVLRSLRRKH